MAQAGYTPIQIYSSSTASAAPSAGNLTNSSLGSELAVNITDGKLYYKDNAGVVQVIASKAGASGDVVGPASATDNAVARFDGTTGKLVQNSAVTIADTTGDITGGAYNKVTITAPATSATLTIANGKTLTANNSLTLSGTDGTTMTFPSSTTTVAGIDSTQTLTNKRVTPRVSTTASSATPTINTDTTDVFGLTAQTVDITSFTTNLSGTPTDGQLLRIYIVGTAARAITWGASFESSNVTLPTTTVSTNRLDIGFIWNAATSKWRCVAVA